jgi:hypothetical protein
VPTFFIYEYILYTTSKEHYADLREHKYRWRSESRHLVDEVFLCTKIYTVPAAENLLPGHAARTAHSSFHNDITYTSSPYPPAKLGRTPIRVDTIAFRLIDVDDIK